MLSISHIFKLFEQCIADYHKIDNIDQPIENPYPESSLECILYEKNWIDTVQWHCEDLVRDTAIEPHKGLELKRRIDSLNQQRTNMVEKIDVLFFTSLNHPKPSPNAYIPTETPAWAIDRLSILALKIYHFQEECSRPDISPSHHTMVREKLNTLLEQKKDLINAITHLLSQISKGNALYKLYFQMKMYNDSELNPVLRNAKNRD